MKWSYHQYRRVGQQVVHKDRRSSASIENQQTAPSELIDGKTSEQYSGPQEVHIFVRESGDDDPFDPRNVCIFSPDQSSPKVSRRYADTTLSSGH
jgi:hypothetical protein